MKYTKIPIALNDVPQLTEEFKRRIKDGDLSLENIRCRFSFDNQETPIYLYTVFDWLDNPPREQITSFTLYQALPSA